jgi:hypothetical protein
MKSIATYGCEFWKIKKKYWLWKWTFGAESGRTSGREKVRNEIIREQWIQNYNS